MKKKKMVETKHNKNRKFQECKGEREIREELEVRRMLTL